jgi:anti-sigma factor RsiW
MSCPPEGTLRTHIDGELSATEANTVEQHLRACDTCRNYWAKVAAQTEQVRQKLDTLAPETAETPIDAALAYTRYRQQYGSEFNNRDTWRHYMLNIWRRPLWGGIAAACALVLLLSFAPSRTWAQKFLAMLRVQKLAVVPVDFSAISSENGNTGKGKLIAQLISDNVVVTMDPGKPVIASNLETAREMAGFNLRTLDTLGSPEQISVSGEGAFHMTLDRDRIQAVLDQAGRSDVQIPDAVDGSTVAVHAPKLVRLLYGACSEKGAPSGENCIEFAQVPSPTVSVPPSLDIAALAEAGLQVAGMSAAEAHAFCQTVDWSSTLVIPIPQNGSSYRTIPVDGVSGTLIEAMPHGNFIGRYALIWIKNGVVYSLSGKGQPDKALSLAASLN